MHRKQRVMVTNCREGNQAEAEKAYRGIFHYVLEYTSYSRNQKVIKDSTDSQERHGLVFPYPAVLSI